jgi:hypothetical protein
VVKHLLTVSTVVKELLQSEVADLTYGGTVANDNSGSIKYLRIEYAGAAFNSEKEFGRMSLLELVQELQLTM